MSEVTVIVTAMGFRVPLSRDGCILGTKTHIGQFAAKFEQWEYDRQLNKDILINEYFYFDKVKGIVHFPRYALDEFKSYLFSSGLRLITVEDPGVLGKEVEFQMLPHITYKNEKQRTAVEYLTNDDSGPLRGLALQTGVGKASRISSLFRTPSGWVENGSVKLGQMLSMPDGTTAPVVGIYPQGEMDIYRVTFEDGRFTDVTLDHLWDVYYVQWAEKWRVITTEQIIQYLTQPTYAARIGVKLIEPVYTEDIKLPIDPYVLGVYLGDGNCDGNGVRISKPDDWLRLEVGRLLSEDHEVSEFTSDGMCFGIKMKDRNKGVAFSKLIHKVGLVGKISHTKFIPQIYMEASPRQRLALIQGLMDTDGTVGVSPGRGNTEKTHGKGGTVQFCTTSYEMAKQIQYLIWSLGGLCKIKFKKPFYTYKGERLEGRNAYILYIRYKNPRDLFRLPRKRDRLNEDYQYADRLRLRIKSVEFVGRDEAQCIMVDHPDHLYIADNFIATHNTVSHIWALQKLRRRSMTTMTSRMEQWVNEMGVYTTLEEDDLYVIQGEASLTKLFNQIDKKIFPKLIIASTKTIRLYLEYGEGYKHLPHPTNFCEELDIGIIGSDEYHEHFNSNLMMMLAFNPRIFIPITATFVASSPYVRNIFNSMIPKSVQFSGGEYDKFVDVVTYRYTGGAHYIKPFNYMRAKGYSQNKFEEYLLGKKGESVLNALLNDAILPIIKEHYIKIAEKGEKFLMICSSKEFCDYLAGVFKRVFRDKTTSVFYSGMPSNVLERYDMILSTPGSAGTGRDIKGLRTCFAFENTGSEVRNLQFIGRLRGPPQMLNTPVFINLYFACIPQHVNYNNARSMLYGPRALSYKQRNIG